MRKPDRKCVFESADVKKTRIRGINVKKMNRHIRAVISGIIMIGLSIQIALGLLWMGCNFGSFQKFGDSLFYIEVSKSLLCDEYTGALYPVLLLLARGIEDLLSIPYPYVMHLLQVAAAVCAGYFFMGALGEEKRGVRIYGSLALLTVPMAMQCHLALLPHSLTFSALLLELGYAVGAVKRAEPVQGKILARASACWLVSALLIPDYLYLGAVPVVVLWIYDAWKYRRQKGKGIFRHLLLIGAFAGMIAGTNMLIQEPGSYGRPEKTVEAALFRRFAWGSLEESWDEWPEDMKEICPYSDMLEITYYAENMERLLQPKLESELGTARAHELYRELRQYAWDNNAQEILHQIVWDAAGYTLPSLTLRMFLQGRGYDSYAGRNYEIMKEQAPRLTKYYVDYSGWWLVVGIVLSAVSAVLAWLSEGSVSRRSFFAGTVSAEKDFSGKVFMKRRSLISALLCIITAGVSVLWYTFQGAGVWDYKNVLLSGALWVVWMVVEMRRGMECLEVERNTEEGNTLGL